MNGLQELRKKMNVNGSKFISTIRQLIYLCMALMMSACERFESKAEIEEYQLKIIPGCLGEESPYDDFQIIDGINLSDKLSLNFDYNIENYSLDVNGLFEGFDIQSVTIGELFTPPVRSELVEHDNDPETLTLTTEQISALEKANLTLSSVSLVLSYIDENLDSKNITFEEGLSNAYIPLFDGLNNIEVGYTASIEVPVIGAECDDYSEQSTRIITVSKTYFIEINKKSISDFVGLLDRENITLPDFLPEGSKISSIDLDEKYLAIGLAGDSSSLSGIHSASTLDSVDSSAESSGAVLVYRKNNLNDEWFADSYIKPPIIEAGDSFGYKVAVEGQLLAVSAPGEDSDFLGAKALNNTSATDDDLVSNINENSGAVFVYKNLNSEWFPLSFVKRTTNLESSAIGEMSFGLDMDLYGGELFVTDPYLSNGGGVSIYKLSGDEFNYSQLLQASNADAGDGFGFSISASGSVVAVGAPFEDSNGRGVILEPTLTNETKSSFLEDNSRTDSGAVYTYVKNESGTAWLENSYLKASNADNDDHFGFSVASFGCEAEVIKDKTYYCHIIAGAPREDGSSSIINTNLNSNSTPDSGAVYLFKALDNLFNISEAYYFKSDLNQSFSQFGASVATDGGFLSVSQPLYRDNDDVRGRALFFQYDKIGDAWSIESSLSGEADGDNYGELLNIRDKLLAIKSSPSSVAIFQ